MELKDEIRIAAPRERVYRALNDPDVLKDALPGCEEIEKISDTEYTAKILVKIGPVKARFSGKVTLDPSGAPEHFSLQGEGTGGAAGFAKGGADVNLAEESEETVLTYDAKAEVGGKLAQIGSRLVLSSSRKLAGQFFQRFKEIVESDEYQPTAE